MYAFIVLNKPHFSSHTWGTGKGLAAHLEVPLPYLLYRVNARFQEEIRGLKDIQGALSPPSATSTNTKFETLQTERPLLAIKTGIYNSKLSSSRLSTPRNVRARLNSLGNNPLLGRPHKAISSSTLTLQGVKRNPVALRPRSPMSSDGSLSESDEEIALKEEAAERTAEEQETLDRKLEELTRLITNESLGLVRTHKSSRRSLDQGRGGVSSPNSTTGSFRGDSLSSRSDNQSLSSVSSPQGSIPEIPSPRTDSQPHSPPRFNRRISPGKSSSPATMSPRGALGHPQNRRYNQLVSDHGSSHGSEASSFSDLSGKCTSFFVCPRFDAYGTPYLDASLSASALESALMSNIAGMRSTTMTTRL